MNENVYNLVGFDQKQLKAPYKPVYDHVYYLEQTIRTDKLRETAAKSCEVLRRYEFDALAFRGQSGSLIAPVLALQLDKTMLMVRKSSEAHDCHSGRLVEGDLGARTYIIVDDLISSGRTVQTIVREIGKVAPKAACLGVLEYTCLDRVLADTRRPLAPPRAYGFYDRNRIEYY
jgi:orotate phosphoribosyltransferase-like protein